MNKIINIPMNVRIIMNTLWENGYDSYIVGGCVRDSILKRNPNDWDITTEAKPEEIIQLFDKVILTGIKHGTVTVIINKEQYEVTTYRFDGEYQDGRHPEQVKFVKDLKEDLARRDFTINAIAYNQRKGIVDYFDGIQDLNKRIIRTVGGPEKRFSEDALRMIRAVRFSSQLNFDIEHGTFEAIKKLASNIKKVSKERIRDEFNKIIVTNLDRLDQLITTDLFEYIIPGIQEIYNQINKNTFLSMRAIDNKVYLRLTILLHEIEVIKNKDYYSSCNYTEILIQYSQEILKGLRYDNETIKKILTLITYYDYDFTKPKSIKKLLNKIGYELTKDLLKIKKVNAVYREEKINVLKLEKELKQIIDEDQCFSLKTLNISGKDLIDMGFEKGKKIGIVLEYLLNEVIEENIGNSKAELISKAKYILSK